jgi:hypothetical protein
VITRDIIHLILWLGLLLGFMVVLSITLVRLWKKRPLKRLLIVAATLLACWLSLSPIFDWLWRRETMTRIFGQTFAPKMVYSRIAEPEFHGDGTDVYVFEISKDRISSLTNAAKLSAMGLPRQDPDPEMEEWKTIHWRQAPFLNDSNDIQFVAFSFGEANPSSGASGKQLNDLMSHPTTMFACSYKSGPGAVGGTAG